MTKDGTLTLQVDSAGTRYAKIDATNITVFEPVEDVIKKFEESGQRMKSFQCYTDDREIERVINGGYLQ